MPLLGLPGIDFLPVEAEFSKASVLIALLLKLILGERRVAASIPSTNQMQYTMHKKDLSWKRFQAFIWRRSRHSR